MTYQIELERYKNLSREETLYKTFSKINDRSQFCSFFLHHFNSHDENFKYSQSYEKLCKIFNPLIPKIFI